MSKKNHTPGHCGEDPGDVSRILEYLAGAVYWIAISIRDVLKKWLKKDDK
jgi:hypothetical protein